MDYLQLEKKSITFAMDMVSQGVESTLSDEKGIRCKS